jgi:hypothetical protein
MESRQDGVSNPSEEHYRLAGFALAHALGSIEGGGPLCTLALVKVKERLDFVRYDAKTIPVSIVGARRDLRERLGSGGHAVLVYDGFATVEGDRRDAIIVELIATDGMALGSLIQRYRPSRLGGLLGLARAFVPVPGGVAVIGEPVPGEPLSESQSAALMHGVAEHPEGRRLYHVARADLT